MEQQQNTWQEPAGFKNQLIFLGRTAYEILAGTTQLRQYDKPGHLISLKDIPLRHGVHEFSYDTINDRLIPDGERVLTGHERIQIPAEIAALDGQPSAEDIRYYNKKSRQAGCGFFLADEYLYEYLKGRPVEFDFEGTAFSLDTAKLKLAETANLKNQIDLQQVESSPHGYHLPYHRGRKNLALPGDDPTEVLQVNLDQLVEYDPVGMAKRYGISVGRLPGWDNDLNYPQVLKKLKSFYGYLPDPTQQKVRKKKGTRL